MPGGMTARLAGRYSPSGVANWTTASMSPRFQASYARSTRSTFSCDIARAVSAGSGVGLSVLLRPPYGFEGFRMTHVELLVDHPPVPVRVDPRDVPEGYFDVGRAPAHLHVKQLDYAVSGINQLVLELLAFPRGKPLSPVLSNGVRPAVDTVEIQHRRFGRVQFD